LVDDDLAHRCDVRRDADVRSLIWRGAPGRCRAYGWCRTRSRLSGVVVASAAPQPLQKAAPTGFSRPQLVQMSTRW